MANFSDTVTAVSLDSLPTGAGSLFQDVHCAASTGINVLIVGAGVGGLTAAIECHRKGHSVRVLERSQSASAGGDMFTIGASALKLLENYPGMSWEFDDVCTHNLWMRFRKWTGEAIGEPFPFASGAPGAERWDHADFPRMTTQLRPRVHAMLYHQLERFGIKVHFGKKVSEFYEDATRKVGGVVTENGERFEADLVIAADGLNSRSQSLMPQTGPQAKPTGRTVFRGAFPLELAVADPLVNEYFGLKNGCSPMMQVWMGQGVHAVIMAYVDKHGKNGRLCFGLSFQEPDGQVREESWYDTVSKEEVLSILDRLPGWGDAIKALVRTTPDDTIIAWPLNPRNPNGRWHSPVARVLQLGDAAHGFLPTSGNGATQAMEDGITIAACLAHADKDRVTTAVKVHNLLRGDRVACAQLLGFANAARVQKPNFEAIGKDPSKVQHKQPRWIWSHNAEHYANKNYAKAAASLVPDGPVFANTNIPTGHTPKPWTIDEVEQLQKAGQNVELTGDWS